MTFLISLTEPQETSQIQTELSTPFAHPSLTTS